MIVTFFHPGQLVKVVEECQNPLLSSRKSDVLRIAECKEVSAVTVCKIEGIESYFWAGMFLPLDCVPEFKEGDEVEYVGKTRPSLEGRTLTISRVRHWGGKDFFYTLVNENGIFAQQSFQKVGKTVRYPSLKEVMTDLCNKGTVTENTCLCLNIVNNKEVEKNYNVNDLMRVLRTLDFYHVEADLSFANKMNDALSVFFMGDQIMEELGSNTPAMLPIAAMTELTSYLELTLQVEGKIYLLGFNGIIFDEKEISLPPVQASSG